MGRDSVVDGWVALAAGEFGGAAQFGVALVQEAVGFVGEFSEISEVSEVSETGRAGRTSRAGRAGRAG